MGLIELGPTIISGYLFLLVAGLNNAGFSVCFVYKHFVVEDEMGSGNIDLLFGLI